MTKMTAEDAVNVLKHLERLGTEEVSHPARGMLFRVANHLGEQVARMNGAPEEVVHAPATLRDEFAKAALPGVYNLCVTLATNDARQYPPEWIVTSTAALAYEVADAMLKRRAA